MRHTKTAPHTVKAADQETGVIERIVSVFGNVDYGGDRVMLGAFTDSIERWKNSGDPIPVVFSHDWSNLDAHLGVVDDLKELPPGDPLLPEEIKDNGGLWVREKYDMHVPAAARAFELQARRSLKESSFAYTTTAERKTQGGINDLLALEIIEVGPCLKGMNPATQLLAAKSVDPDAELPELITVGPGGGGAGSKAYVTLEGSYEKLMEDLTALLPDWTVLNFPNEDWWHVGIEATYPDSVVVYMETWADPVGRGNYQQAAWTRDDDGALRLEVPRLVAVSGNVVPKALRPAAAKLAGKAERATTDADSGADGAPVDGLSPASFLTVADMELAALPTSTTEGAPA